MGRILGRGRRSEGFIVTSVRRGVSRNDLGYRLAGKAKEFLDSLNVHWWPSIPSVSSNSCFQ